MIFSDPGRVEVIKVLINNGIDVNYKTPERAISALFWTGMMIDFIKCIKKVSKLKFLQFSV